MEARVANKYKIIKKIGSGSFGEIFLGINVLTNEQIAMKLEPQKARHPQLMFEAKLLKWLGGKTR